MLSDIASEVLQMTNAPSPEFALEKTVMEKVVFVESRMAHSAFLHPNS